MKAGERVETIVVKASELERLRNLSYREVVGLSVYQNSQKGSKTNRYWSV